MTDIMIIKARDLLRLAEPAADLSEENKDHWYRWRDQWLLEVDKPSEEG